MDAFTRTIQGGKRGSMTNEEAVKYFKRHIDLYCVTGICRDAEIMAIKALSQQTEYHGTEDMDGLYYCPVCQQTTTVVKDGKCPKCGATMDELSTRAQQTEDAISRQAAVYVASGFCHPANIADELAKLPPVTPKQRIGHWIEHPEIKTSVPEYLMFYRCSECGDKQCFCKPDIHKKHFCINCGAKMAEPQESEDQE